MNWSLLKVVQKVAMLGGKGQGKIKSGNVEHHNYLNKNLVNVEC